MSRKNISMVRAKLARRFSANNESSRPRAFEITLVLLVLYLVSSVAWAQGGGLFPGLSALSESDARQAAIGFVNMTASPGLEGTSLRLDQDNRHSEHWRSALGFNAEFTLRDPIVNGYWGLALVGGGLEDKVELVADNGDPVKLDLSREVVALRGSLGLSFPVDEHVKIRPVLSLVFSDLQTESVIDDRFGFGTGPSAPARARFKTSAQMLSTVAGLEGRYTRWYGERKLELSAHYNVIYTDAVSEDNPILQGAESWDRTLQVKSRLSGPTKWVTDCRPWRWNADFGYTNFLSIKEYALGYDELFDIGVGLGWQMNIKPLDWFGWQAIGLRAGMTLGKDVQGFTIGMTAQ